MEGSWNRYYLEGEKPPAAVGEGPLPILFPNIEMSLDAGPVCETACEGLKEFPKLAPS